VLGKRYQLRAASDDAAAVAPLDDAEVARLLQEWLRIPWFSYRSGMPPICPGSNITTDAGWGCTLRSGQMLLARALVAHCIGFDDAEDAAVRSHLLGLFRDTPTSSFGLHALCKYGRAAGVTVGSWLGPHALCNALQATVAHALAPGQLHVHVVSGGGGAPTLYREDIADECRRRAQAPPSPDPPAVVLPLHQAGEHQEWTPILLLIPLTLGLGRCINQVYASQVCAALALTHSCGIVGGRPGSSLFFVGCQGDSVLYLDPHEVQAHAASDDGACEGEAETDSAGHHRCSVVRHTPLSSIDPSMALGFYAGTEAAFEELCDRLQALEQSARGAPLMTVAPRAVRTPLAVAGAAAGGSEEGVIGEEEDGAQDEWMVV
jgi:cysteine protease ATG4